MGYKVPSQTVRTEYAVSRSRFIATLSNVETVEAARTFIAAVRTEMPDASHHVYAFKIGFGSSITEGLSDDGEPTGTAGPPVMEVLRGAEIGNAVFVITRYFGGIKLGTGGLVRAYRTAAQAALAICPLHEKIEMRRLSIVLPYSLYERLKLIVAAHQAIIDQEQFEAEVTLHLTIPLDTVERFTTAVRDLSAGRVIPQVITEC